jgi:hypothetical protein
MQVKEGDIVVIKSAEEALINSDNEWEEHYFLVDEVFEDLVTGYSLTGSLKDVYGEPELTLIKKVYREVTN